MSVIYRTGAPKDIPAIAHYLHQASWGLSDFLLEGLLADHEIKDFIELAVADESTNVFYKNTIVAEYQDTIEGIINFYPANQHEIPDLMYSLIPQERLDLISPLFTSLPENSFYIHALACNRGFYQANLFAALMLRGFQFAKSAGYSLVCAHVWPNNAKFLKVLLRAGGQILQTIPMETLSYFQNQPEIYLVGHDLTQRK